MKGICFALVCLAFSFSLKSQEKIRVNAGEDFSKILNSYGIYRFPTFFNSKIFFRNGNQSTAMLNYNLVLSAVQFLNPPADTLSIGNPEKLYLLEIDSVLYYYDKRYLEVIVESADEVKPARWQQIKIEFEQLGAFEKPSNGVDVQSYRNIKSGMVYNSKDFVANQNRIITKETKYFLVDKFGKSFPANKGIFYNLFPGNKTRIQEYIQTANVHFDRLDDLKGLYKACKE